MKIIAVDIWTVVVPTIPGRVHSPEWVPETGWDQVPKQILRIETDAGAYGLGESYRGVTEDEVIQGATLLPARRIAEQIGRGAFPQGKTVSPRRDSP